MKALFLINLFALFFGILITKACFAATILTDGQVVRTGSSISIKPMDLLDLHYVEEWEAFTAIYDTLFQYQIDTGFTPIIAQTWAFDSHKKTITFKIKPHLKFSDSSPLTAQDVVFSLKRMIHLDRSGKHAITRCFRLPGTQFSSPTQVHPLIQAPDLYTVRLGPSTCGESFLKDLAEGAYGIVSPRGVDKNFSLLPDGPVSGAFSFSYNSNRFLLKPNPKNWRWEKKSNLTSIEITKMNEASDLSRNLGLDFFRTADPSLVEAAQKAGYKSQISLPIMVWYLAPKNLPETKTPWQAILADINQNLDKNRIESFKNNSLEFPASTFFPTEYNCDKKTTNSKKSSQPVHSRLDREQFTIELVDHKSNESKSWLANVRDLLTELGYKTKIVYQDAPTTDSPDKTLRLQAYRQFLGDGNINSLTFAFNTIHAIPDLSGKMTTLLAKLERSGINETAQTAATTQRLCKRLYHYNHIPIAHRKIAFLTRDEKFFPLFGRGNGNIFFTNFPNISEGH